jgi:hypothetical protein
MHILAQPLYDSNYYSYGFLWNLQIRSRGSTAFAARDSRMELLRILDFQAIILMGEINPFHAED